MRESVLVVDDDPIDRKLIARALSNTGREPQVEWAIDGVEALDRLRGGLRPAIVLVDLNMPRMDGRQLLTAIKADPSLHSIPTVILSSSADVRDIADCYRRHANAYVSKPDSVSGYAHFGESLVNFWFGAVRFSP